MNRAERRAAVRQNNQNQPTLTAAAAAPAATAATNVAAAPGQEQQQQQPQSATTPNQISAAQLAANRANAQLSSGPRSDATKSISCMNALKTGLTGRTVLLPTDDVAIYQQHIARVMAMYLPWNDDEKALVHSIADTEWRLLRIGPLEAGYFALGRHKFAADPIVLEAAPENRQALIQTLTFDHYRKELNNLALQERRLRNNRKADIAEFDAMRAENIRRRSAHTAKLQNDVIVAQKVLANAEKMQTEINLADFGFEFSKSELAAYLTQNQLAGKLFENAPPLNVHTFLHKYRAQQQREQQPKAEPQAQTAAA